MIDHPSKKQHPSLPDGIFSGLAHHFAKLLLRLSGSHDPALYLAAGLVSRVTSSGAVCLDLREVAGTPLSAWVDPEAGINCPDFSDWIDALHRSDVVGKPGLFRPLILDGKGRLYLYRYWAYERAISNTIHKRVSEQPATFDATPVGELLLQLFPAIVDGRFNRQALACLTVLMNRFCVISGGPGTGKTHTVARFLALLVQQAHPQPLRIRLVAPTGKAATRLNAAIRSAKSAMPCGDALKTAIPEDASTIHRLLSSLPGSPYFRHNADNPVPADVVVVDEASMVDVALMAKLLDALREDARIILIGDKDQLASVQSGSILGGIYHPAREYRIARCYARVVKQIYGLTLDPGEQAGAGIPEIQGCIVALEKNYRFDERSGISKLSQAIKTGNPDAAMEILGSGEYPDICWQEHASAMETGLMPVLDGFADTLTKQNPSGALEQLNRVKILCAVNRGPFGVDRINSWAENHMRTRAPASAFSRFGTHWYPGRPVLITRNHHELELYNGDIGILLPDPDGAELAAFFPGPGGALRKIPLFRLPEHLPAYALTVHKSQGSEFNEVFLVLPDRDVPVLTRELLYTAITRGKERVTIVGSESIFRKAVDRQVKWTSGLRDVLWGEQ